MNGEPVRLGPVRLGSVRLGPVRLGMVRLTDAAPVVHAFAHGGFSAAGVDVRLAVEPSWANIADKLAWGLLDGAVMLPPLAIAMTLGLREPLTELIIPSGISRNGNAITLATALADRVPGHAGATLAERAGRLRGLLPLRLAVVHAFSTHDLLLRLFLEAGGIDPAALGPFAVVPPADMVQALADGRIDGFCAGAPWGAVAAEAGVGRTIAFSAEIVPDHPEKCLAVRADWAASRPEALVGMLHALARSAEFCDDPAHAPALAALLATPDWVGVPAGLIAGSLPGGRGEAGRSRFTVVTGARDAAWLTAQLSRWRAMPAGASARIKRMYEQPNA